jgi:hypothetical protein
LLSAVKSQSTSAGPKSRTISLSSSLSLEISETATSEVAVLHEDSQPVRAPVQSVLPATIPLWEEFSTGNEIIAIWPDEVIQCVSTYMH